MLCPYSPLLGRLGTPNLKGHNDSKQILATPFKAYSKELSPKKTEEKNFDQKMLCKKKPKV